MLYGYLKKGSIKKNPAISRSSFTLIKRLFSSSLLSAIRVVSSIYLRLLNVSPTYPDSGLQFTHPGISHDVLHI